MQKSTHAEKRMKQRAISSHDIELITQYGKRRNRRGSQVALCNAQSRSNMLNNGISPQIADRLKGCYVVFQGDTIVTVAHCCKRLHCN